MKRTIAIILLVLATVLMLGAIAHSIGYFMGDMFWMQDGQYEEPTFAGGRA